MRITNKIMQNNSLYNINNNKLIEDKLSSQMATGKTLTRPSDDPVVAIRALRLRTNVSTVTQYYKKNAPDAELWLSTTEDSLGTVNTVLTDMVKQATSGANEYKGAEAFSVIMEQIKELCAEVYATGDTDYAGRYIFTGFRTDTSLTFQEETTNRKYTITEQQSRDDLDKVSYIETKDLFNMNGTTYGDSTTDERDIASTDIFRMRLSYEQTDGINSSTEISALQTDLAALNADLAGLTDAAAIAAKKDEIAAKEDELRSAMGIPTLEQWYVDPDTHEYVKGSNEFKVSYDEVYVDRNAAMQAVAQAGDTGNKIVYCKETGELFMTKDVYEKLNANSDKTKGEPDNQAPELRVTYGKTHFDGDDFRPEHYFACTADVTDKDGNISTIDYNGGCQQRVIPGGYLTEGRDAARQEITYDVGANQKIRINTTADEVFNPNIQRDVDDLQNRLNDLISIEKTIDDLTTAYGTATETEQTAIQVKIDAAKKAQTYIRDDLNKMFGTAITKFQSYIDQTNVAITANGARSQRLELVSNRLGSQKTTYETLQSENEEIGRASCRERV
mgnify:CR=1 FL=1